MCPLPPRQSVRCRGQSSVVGLVLVFGMVLAGTVTVVVLGAGAIEDTQEQVSQERTEKAMTQFDSKVALVALGNTDVQQVSFGQDRTNSYDVDEGSGWMRVSIENQTDGSTSTLLNESLGAVTTENGDTKLAYQGGGVWRTAGGNASVMVSPPEFHFRNGTLTLPVVNVTGAEQLGDRVSISNRETVTKYPDASAGDENPLSEHKIVLTVKSEYYQGWGSYFETRTDGVVDYDHDRKIANLTLKTPAGKRKVQNAVSATSNSGELFMSGSGGSPARMDSYNSSNGPYDPATAGSKGNITIGGDVTLSGNAEIYGDIRSGGTVDCGSGSVDIDGTVWYTDSYNSHPSGCSSLDGAEQIGGISDTSPINSHVEDTVDDAQADNDNAGTPADGNSITYTSGDATLTAGTYFLTDLTVPSGNTLELDTTGGPITIGVRDYVEINSNTDIDVQGNGRVKVYLKGEDKTNGNSHHFYMGSDAEVNKPPVGTAENASQFWVYGQSDLQGKFADSGAGPTPGLEFVGVIYAPGGPSGTGEVVVEEVVYGSIVASTVKVNDPGGAVHYDLALQNERALPPNTKIVKITYLHVSVSRVEVS